jgi:hypothetical protein
VSTTTDLRKGEEVSRGKGRRKRGTHFSGGGRNREGRGKGDVGSSPSSIRPSVPGRGSAVSSVLATERIAAIVSISVVSITTRAEDSIGERSDTAETYTTTKSGSQQDGKGERMRKRTTYQSRRLLQFRHQHPKSRRKMRGR